MDLVVNKLTLLPRYVCSSSYATRLSLYTIQMHIQQRLGHYNLTLCIGKIAGKAQIRFCLHWIGVNDKSRQLTQRWNTKCELCIPTNGIVLCHMLVKESSTSTQNTRS